MTDMVDGAHYQFKDLEQDPSRECGQVNGWEYIEYSDYKPGDLLRGNLWIKHSKHIHHKLEVFGDGHIDDHGEPFGTIEDLELLT